MNKIVLKPAIAILLIGGGSATHLLLAGDRAPALRLEISIASFRIVGLRLLEGLCIM